MCLFSNRSQIRWHQNGIRTKKWHTEREPLSILWVHVLLYLTACTSRQVAQKACKCCYQDIKLSVLWPQVTQSLALILFICSSYNCKTMLLKIHPTTFFDNITIWCCSVGISSANWRRHQLSDYSLCTMSRGRNQFGWTKRAGTDHYNQCILWLLFCLRLWYISLHLQAFP